MATVTLSPDRATWRESVAAIADKDRAKPPECNGRADKGIALVIAADVELLPDGAVKVISQSNSTTAYRVVNSHCDCRDYKKMIQLRPRRSRVLRLWECTAPCTMAAREASSCLERRAPPLVTVSSCGTDLAKVPD
jgi:hypothetical protein